MAASSQIKPAGTVNHVGLQYVSPQAPGENIEIYDAKDIGVTASKIGEIDVTTGVFKFDEIAPLSSTLLCNGINLNALASVFIASTRTISTTSPLSGGGDLSANRTLTIADAAANGSTKGAAAFTAADFNSSSGVISIDYDNGQKASGSVSGFVSTTAQSFAGSKTFTGPIAATGTPDTNGVHILADSGTSSRGYVRPISTDSMEVRANAGLLSLESASTVRSTTTRDNTTATAANCVVSATTGNFARSTSSIKYKKDVFDLEKQKSNEIFNLRPVRYKSKASLDDPTQEHIGLIAEEVALIEPALIHWKDNGDGTREPEGIQYERLSVMLLGVVSDQQGQINDLIERVSKLEGKK